MIETRKDLAMTDSEPTQQDTELNPEPSVKVDVSEGGQATTSASEEGDQAATDVSAESDQATTEQAIVEAGEEGVAADYETRIREFDQVESTPVVSVPVQSSQLEKDDLEVQAPGGQSG
jgi:hypothetical protein